jgi:hypothetical protein
MGYLAVGRGQTVYRRQCLGTSTDPAIERLFEELVLESAKWRLKDAVTLYML